GRLDPDRMWNDVALWILDTVGNRERSHRRTEEALRAFQVEKAIFDELAPQFRDHHEGRSLQRYQYEVFQKIRTLRGQAGETAEALMLREKPEDPHRLIARATALLAAASHERGVGGAVSPETRAALGEVFQRLERSTITDPGGLYN